MPSVPSAASRASRLGAPAPDLTVRLRRTVADWAPDLPLPTTREYGKRFKVASATAYRVLQKMARAGEIWQHPVSGRYYPAAARALLDRPKPVACLIRRLELDSEQYREILEGISLGCGALHRTMLLWHDELLVNHPEPHASPVFAGLAQQRAILKDFLARHGDAAGGFVLDHVWRDDVLRGHLGRLQPAVVLFRACTIPEFSNIRVDFRAGALLALTHLLGRGFDRIIPVEPFSGDPAVVEFFAALDQAVEETGCRERVGRMVQASTDAQRSTLLETLRRPKRRTALLCPEDNVATFLQAGLQGAGLSCPEQIGLLSVMGTDVVMDAAISCLRYDFRALGRLAIEAMRSDAPMQHVLAPQLFPAKTS